MAGPRVVVAQSAMQTWPHTIVKLTIHTYIPTFEYYAYKLFVRIKSDRFGLLKIVIDVFLLPLTIQPDSPYIVVKNRQDNKISVIRTFAISKTHMIMLKY